MAKHAPAFHDTRDDRYESTFLLYPTIKAPASDPVNRPEHYTAYKNLEVIDLTEQLNFCRGNAVKYIARAGLKDKSKEIEDLKKARWYIDREISRLLLDDDE